MQRENKKQFRDYRDMMAAILENLQNTNNEGAGLTYLIFTVETPWNNILPLLDELIDKGMIAMKALPGMRPDTKRHRIYFITLKGTKFLHLYKKLKENLK